MLRTYICLLLLGHLCSPTINTFDPKTHSLQKGSIIVDHLQLEALRLASNERFFSFSSEWHDKTTIPDYRTSLSCQNMIRVMQLPRIIRLLKAWLHILCFHITIRRPWWKDNILLRACLFLLLQESVHVYHVLRKHRPVEIALADFAFQWLMFGYTGFCAPFDLTQGLVWCFAFLALRKNYHMPGSLGCRIMSVNVTWLLSNNLYLSAMAFLLPSYGFARIDYQGVPETVPRSGDGTAKIEPTSGFHGKCAIHSVAGECIHNEFLLRNACTFLSKLGGSRGSYP